MDTLLQAAAAADGRAPASSPTSPAGNHPRLTSSSGRRIATPAGAPTHINYPKKRVSVACEICRTRKTRCDASRPACSFCSQIGANCVYRVTGNTCASAGVQSAPVARERSSTPPGAEGEVISRLVRIEGLLQRLQPPRTSTSHVASSPRVLDSPGERSPSSYQHSRVVHTVGGPSFASISSLDGYDFPAALRPLSCVDFEEGLELELYQGERIFQGTPVGLANLSLSPRRCWQLQQIFYRDVLPWCPIVDQQACSEIVTRTVESHFDKGNPDTGLTLFILALGAFAESSQHLADDSTAFPGRDYFRVACQLVDSDRVFSNTIQHVQCHILMSFYFLYCLRPIQAFEAVRRASEKIVLLLQLRSRLAADPAYRELCHRSYWACYLVEHELQPYVSFSTYLLQEFEEVLPLPMSDYEEPGIYWFLSAIALRRIFTRPRGGRGWNSYTLYEPAVVDEIASQMAQWQANLPGPVKFEPEDPYASDSVNPTPLLDPLKVFLRAQFYAIHATIYWQYVVRLLTIPPPDVPPHGSKGVNQEHARITEAAALSLRYSVIHILAVQSLLQGRHLLLLPNMTGLLCNTLFLLCSYNTPGLENIQHTRAKDAILIAWRCFKTWDANPSIQRYVQQIEELMKAKNIEPPEQGNFHQNQHDSASGSSGLYSTSSTTSPTSTSTTWSSHRQDLNITAQ
ncbi:hypothetical protein NKR23_g9723 [Pleurostoma richardsiae]|uniref:Zn(2)-C6 fungal-type domain-containing protein n=1 Tax=Pleurostoma richardsiae TaxID=41990 RepID=A0AA38RPM3_9PEZI|nr:hypothetical protein NKR23_g9723 [Pleurostoma richardsiae]